MTIDQGISNSAVELWIVLTSLASGGLCSIFDSNSL